MLTGEYQSLLSKEATCTLRPCSLLSTALSCTRGKVVKTCRCSHTPTSEVRPHLCPWSPGRWRFLVVWCPLGMGRASPRTLREISVCAGISHPACRATMSHCRLVSCFSSLLSSGSWHEFLSESVCAIK